MSQCNGLQIASFEDLKPQVSQIALQIVDRFVGELDFTTKNSLCEALGAEIARLLVSKIETMKDTAEKALAANHAKDQFLANMSHEIRTPLTAILGFSNLMLEPHISAVDLGEFSNTITRNAEHLLSLIDEVLDFAKIEAGKIVVEKKEFSLPEMFKGVENLFRTHIRNKSLQLCMKNAVEFNQPIIGDLVRLQQVVINLVGNAIKFTESGLVEIEATLENHSKNTLVIVVRDTGIGISREAQSKLFSPFMQADGSVTKKYGGSGLGLAISRRLAEALGGQLSLSNSELGKGSTFTLTVPIEFAAPYLGVPQHQEGVANNGDDTRLAGLHILLAEDSADNQLLYRKFLERSAATVAIAGDGCEAVSLAESQIFDLVLMDIQMPRLNGYEATQRLRSSGFTKPILALTAHALDREIQIMEAAGCNGRIIKPVQPDELINCIVAAAHSFDMARPSV